MSTLVYMNTEVSNDGKTDGYHSKKLSNHTNKKSFGSQSINYEQKIETSHFRPQTTKHRKKKNDFLLKSHSPRFFEENFPKRKNLLTENLNEAQNTHKEELKENFIKKIKELDFYIKNDEIIKNLVFFEKLRNFCKLNFYSSFEESIKMEKEAEEITDEDLFQLIFLNLKNLETSYLPSLLKNEIVSEDMFLKLFFDINEFVS